MLLTWERQCQGVMPQPHGSGKTFSRWGLEGHPLVQVGPFTGCAEMSTVAFSPPPSCLCLQTASLKRLLLPRLAKPVSLFICTQWLHPLVQLYATTQPSSSTVYHKHAELSRVLWSLCMRSQPTRFQLFSVFVFCSFPYQPDQINPWSHSEYGTVHAYGAISDW